MEETDLRIRLQKRLALTDQEVHSLLIDSGGFQVARKLLRQNKLSEETLREKRYEFVLFEAGLLTREDLEMIREFRHQTAERIPS